MLEIVHHKHAKELIELSGDHLEKRETENNLPFGLAHTLAADPGYYGPEPPLLLSIRENGGTACVAVRTPPHRIVLSVIETELEAVVDHLIRYLRTIDASIPGVVGPETEARYFSGKWTKTVPGVTARPAKRLRVFEARSVVDVPLSPGRLRHAEMEDLPLMAKWIAKFSSEAIGKEPEPGRAERNAEKYIAGRKLYVWDHDGPVSIVKESRAMKNGTVISLVYTPPELRSRGYATSSVYQLTKKLLIGGYKFCSLFTDLANPASNHIYPKIGFVPLGDTLEFDFEITAAHGGSQVVT